MCVYINSLGKKASWKKKKGMKEKKCKISFSSFLFYPLKKLWFLNCPPNFLDQWVIALQIIMIIRILWLTRRDFLNFENYKSRWTIRNKDECWWKKNYYELNKEKLYRCHKQIDFNWKIDNIFIHSVSRPIYVYYVEGCSNPFLSFHSDNFVHIWHFLMDVWRKKINLRIS